MKLTKKNKEALSNIDKTKLYSADEAVALLKSLPKAKFDETFDIAVNLGIDVRHADQQVRGVADLPAGTGKVVKVAVFARDEKADAATAAGADFVGAEDLMEKINSGFMDFDRCIATPDMMGVVGRLGKVLGPRNLMPNPKTGTVTPDVAAAVKAVKGGQVQFRADKSGIVHCGIGKISFSESDLVSNFDAFMKVIKDSKPSGAKGTYIKSVSISTTMGAGLKIDVSNF